MGILLQYIQINMMFGPTSESIYLMLVDVAESFFDPTRKNPSVVRYMQMLMIEIGDKSAGIL